MIIIRRWASHMSAWQIHSPSTDFKSLVFNKSVPIPFIRSPKEVLIKVCASSVNPLDIKMCSGYGNTLLERLNLLEDITKAPQSSFDRYPLSLGRDFSGTVIQKGSSVEKFNVGDDVWGVCSPYLQGCHSEYVIVNARNLAKKPSNLKHVEAATLPFSFLTAFSAIFVFGGLNEHNSVGKRILILGGSGGIGTVAIQLLKSWGAIVYATCSSDAIEWLSESTNVDQCIDYNSNLLQSYKNTFDIVLDARPNIQSIDDSALMTLKAYSKYITLTSPLLKNIDSFGLLPGILTSLVHALSDTGKGLNHKCSVRWAYFLPNQTALAYLSRIVEEEKIRPIVQKVYQFNQLLEAYIKVQDGHLRGKIAIQL